MRSPVAIFFAAVSTLVIAGLGGCAQNMTPAQSRAWDAFHDCKKLAPTANITQLTPEGSLGFESREGDYQIMIQCLDERYGYKSR
jgi:hypothetical protein